jgi:hypothetical protein
MLNDPPEDLKLVNCANCNRELIPTFRGLSPETEAWARLRTLMIVAGRIMGRPWCRDCLALNVPQGGRCGGGNRVYGQAMGCRKTMS